jgi:hypothetical protein
MAEKFKLAFELLDMMTLSPTSPRQEPLVLLDVETVELPLPERLLKGLELSEAPSCRLQF